MFQLAAVDLNSLLQGTLSLASQGDFVANYWTAYTLLGSLSCEIVVGRSLTLIVPFVPLKHPANDLYNIG